MRSIAESQKAAPSLRPLAVAFFTFAGFLVLGYASILLTGPSQKISLVWPATAFAVVMVARLSRSTVDDIFMLTAVLLGGLSINLAGHTPEYWASVFPSSAPSRCWPE